MQRGCQAPLPGIHPLVHCPNLASRVLGLVCRRLAADWFSHYGYRPVLLETFVQRPRFTGTAYRAANWRYVGLTKGRGKLEKRHKAILPQRAIFLYPCASRFQKRYSRAKPQRLHGIFTAYPSNPRSRVNTDLRILSDGEDGLRGVVGTWFGKKCQHRLDWFHVARRIARIEKEFLYLPYGDDFQERLAAHWADLNSMKWILWNDGVDMADSE